jgi:hypothetical protein
MTLRWVAKLCAMPVALAVLAGTPHEARAHCDSVAGPVVGDARLALESGDPAPVLKWVGEAYEDEIRTVFRQAAAVRALGGDAKALAERHFFETVVRIHRAGEGEAFAGLKPASAIDPGLAAADKALRTGSVDELAARLSASVADGIRSRFAITAERSKHALDSVAAGREYVAAYVQYVHFVESANQLVSEGASTKHHEPTPTP